LIIDYDSPNIVERDSPNIVEQGVLIDYELLRDSPNIVDVN
jgi:hypothetical protein